MKPNAPAGVETEPRYSGYADGIFNGDGSLAPMPHEAPWVPDVAPVYLIRARDEIAQLKAQAETYHRHVTQLANQIEERDHMLAEMAVQLREALAEVRRLEDAQVRLIRSAAGNVDVGPEAMPERALGHCWAAGKFPR